MHFSKSIATCMDCTWESKSGVVVAPETGEGNGDKVRYARSFNYTTHVYFLKNVMNTQVCSPFSLCIQKMVS